MRFNVGAICPSHRMSCCPIVTHLGADDIVEKVGVADAGIQQADVGPSKLARNPGAAIDCGAMKLPRPRMTYANVMATIAVFVALGGASYAAITIPRNSVGTKQLKNGAVTAQKVKTHSLVAGDFAPGELPAGAQGPKGDPGPSSAASGPVTADKLNIPATYISAGLPDGTPGCGSNQGFVNWKPETYEPVGYYRGPDGIVHLRGTAAQCSPFNGIIFHLPPGYRPSGRSTFVVSEPEAYEGGPKVSIGADGEVLAWVPNTEYKVALDGISFRCGPSGGAGCP